MAGGIGLQLTFAIIVILVPGGRAFFDFLSSAFVKVVGFALVGSQFIFNDLADVEKFGFVFAFQVLPTIIFFAALMGAQTHKSADDSGNKCCVSESRRHSSGKFLCPAFLPI